jgi:hypothetical protein
MLFPSFLTTTTTQATMMTTAMLALTFTMPIQQQLSHQTACRPIWSDAASPCYQHVNAHPNGTTTFFASGHFLLDSEDEPPLWQMMNADNDDNDPGK